MQGKYKTIFFMERVKHMRAKCMHEKLTKHRGLSKHAILLTIFLKYLVQWYIIQIPSNYVIQ